MLSPRWRKMARDAALHKSRTLLVMLAVAIGMIADGALLDAWALVRTVTQQTYRASHPVSATLHVDNADAAMLTQVRALPEIAAARVRRVVGAKSEANGTRAGAELFALADFESTAIGKLQAERGSWPPRDGEVVIEHSSLDFSGASLGATIRLQAGDHAAVNLPVSGVARDVGLPPGWMDHIVYAFVTPATLAQLGAPQTFDELQIVVRDSDADRDAVRRLAYTVKAVLERSGHRVDGVDVPVPMQHPHAAQMDSLMLTQGAFALLTLLVVSFLIVNLVSAMLAGQTREIGVMKALGAAAGQIAAMYVVFALVLGLAASALALPVAIALGRPYAALKADMLNFPLDGVSVPWWAIALQLAAGALLPVLAAALPVARACRSSVSASLRDPGIACADGALSVRRRIAIPGLSRPLLLSLGNAFRRRQRTLLTLLALAAGGAVFVGADNLRDAVRASVDSMFASQRYDALLRLAEPYDAAHVEAAAAQVSGIAHAQAFAAERASVVHEGNPGNAFALVGVPPSTPLLDAHAEGGRWLAATDGHAIAVSRALLKDEPGLLPGTDAILDLGGTRATWHIVGIVDTGPQAMAYAPFATIAQVHGDNRAAALAIATQPGADAALQLDAIVRLRAQLESRGMHVAQSQLVRETRRAVEDHLLMVVQFLGAMAWVMIAVGGMGLASTMSISVLERTREIGVLRAIGARHGAIMRLVQAEGLVITLLAWLLSLLLSVPMSLELADAFGRVMFPVPARAMPGASGAFAWLLLALVVSVLACAWPARRAMRVPAAAALKYE